jgi:predicted kinase
MSCPYLIIITGPPASGKTTLGKMLARELGLPFFSKDGIKEALFESLGWSDREWSRRLGLASIDLLYEITACQLAAGKPCVIECNFRPEHDDDRFRVLRSRFAFWPIQVRCNASNDVLMRRYRDREMAGRRHPGHAQPAHGEDLAEALLQNEFEALALDGDNFHVDTTDFGRVNFVDFLGAIKRSVARQAEAG